jgi:hypothetical protein
MTKKSAAADTVLTVSHAQMRGRAAPCEPITVGVPFPRGVLDDASMLELTDDLDRPVALQAGVTERWADGSVRWALLDFQTTGDGRHAEEYRLSADGDGPVETPAGMRVTVAQGSVQVHTGPARFTLVPGAAALFEQIVCALTVRNNVGAVVVTDHSGREWPMDIAHVTCDLIGPLRSTIRLDGHAGPPNRPIVDLRVRVQFFAGSAAVGVAVTVANPRRAVHRGGIWELGDAGSVQLRDLSVIVSLPGTPSSVDCAPEMDHDLERVAFPFELSQTSSGHEASEVPGYTLVSAGTRREGRRATPAILAIHEGGRTGVAVEYSGRTFHRR